MNSLIKEMLSNLQKPAIHLNGSGKEGLATLYQEAARSLEDALETMRQAYPHGRDYYVLPDAELAYRRAEKEHQDRIERVTGVIRELQALAIYARSGGKID